jgi:hypothetical protein
LRKNMAVRNKMGIKVLLRISSGEAHR